jgi:hypothetical protein
MSLLEEYYNVEEKTLTIDYLFNGELNNLPPDVKIILFKENFLKREDSKFNKSLDFLPNSVTHLTLGAEFNQSVDLLPNSITHLIFKRKFNQLVDCLPNSLKHLSLGNYFNQLVDCLPNSLTHLTLGAKFNQSVDNLPKNLTHLNFYGIGFNQSLDTLPSTLIELGFYSRSKIKNYIPFNVPNIQIYFFGINVSSNGKKYTDVQKCKDEQQIDNIPSTVKQIKINNGIYFIDCLKKIPLNCVVRDILSNKIINL